MAGLQVTANTKELKKLAKEVDDLDQKVVVRARKSVKIVTFKTVRRVKEEMPVDTGRARASWQIDKFLDGGLTSIQGSNVEYIPFLNAGSSQQAPAGFIDVAANAAARELDRDIEFLATLKGLGI